MDTGIEYEFAAECLWPGVTAEALHDLEERVLDECSASGERARYLGSVLMPGDEVVLCLFKGCEEEVRRAAEAAGVPFGRLLEALTTSAGDSRGPTGPDPGIT